MQCKFITIKNSILLANHFCMKTFLCKHCLNLPMTLLLTHQKRISNNYNVELHLWK